jgi:tetratricopeptide (TPR) repeat protein
MRVTILLVLVMILVSCSQAEQYDLPDLPAGAQAISLLGDTLYPPQAAAEVQQQREQELADALANHEADPHDADALIWLGRREAYLGNYREAIRTYTQGIETHPTDARMYRHRGHRYITLRMFDRAIADLRRAAELVAGQEDEIEPDGQPNALNIPTSTLQFNIWYHLGLAQYLTGDFASALTSYRECLRVSNNPDALVATSHWLYMTLRRIERDAEAAAVLEPITGDMEIIENDAYHQLLLMYRGQATPESLLTPEEDAVQSATIAYGVGNWYYYNGQQAEAERIFRNILEGGGWAAFGFIAAEAELAGSR